MTKKKTSSAPSTGWAPRCYETHPPYEIAPGIVIYGGSCISPIVHDADVYVGFDAGMKFKAGGYPWNQQKGPVEFLFRIADMQTPVDEVEFAKMITWLDQQLIAGKKIHMGCIGGHGRTGLVLAALRKHMTGDVDATQHVRDNYCKKVVESKTQVDWLKKHWGINPVEPTKKYTYGGGSNSSSTPKSGSKQGNMQFTDYSDGFLDFGRPKDTTKHHADNWDKLQTTTTGMPLHSTSSIWG